MIPCEFNGYVYLCGGGTTGIEAFHPQSNTFLQLQPRLPERTECKVCVDNGQLVVISWKYVTWWEATHAHNLRCVKQSQHKKVEANCCMQPLVKAGQMYAAYDRKFYRVSLDGNEEVVAGS